MMRNRHKEEKEHRVEEDRSKKGTEGGMELYECMKVIGELGG